MKYLPNKIALIALMSSLIISVSSCSSPEEDVVIDKTEINTDRVVVADYAIDGMVCAMGCAKTIQDELSSTNGVASCDVNYEEKTAHIEFDESQLTELEIIALIESLADGKYKVSKKGASTEDVEVEDLEEAEDSEGSIVEVSLPSFEMPNLFELLFKQV
ncbi:MAG: heavy metal-associated domain-containing protein [Vicingaceae bacterium]|nr:heavy metal-associated domain-containing protein [Vicingaceae bacterium]